MTLWSYRLQVQAILLVPESAPAYIKSLDRNLTRGSVPNWSMSYWPIFYRWSWLDRLDGGLGSTHRMQIWWWIHFLRRLGIQPVRTGLLLAYHFALHDRMENKAEIAQRIAYEVQDINKRPTPYMATLPMANIRQNIDVHWLRARQGLPFDYNAPWGVEYMDRIPTGVTGEIVMPAPDLNL